MQVKSDCQRARASLQTLARSPVASDLAVASRQTRGWFGHERSIALSEVSLQSTAQNTNIGHLDAYQILLQNMWVTSGQCTALACIKIDRNTCMCLCHMQMDDAKQADTAV